MLFIDQESDFNFFKILVIIVQIFLLDFIIDRHVNVNALKDALAITL